MTKVKSWQSFRDSGLMWYVNTLLHAFGWAIAVEVDSNNIAINGYPVRVGFRGFSEDINTEGYEKVARYMADNAEEILEEAECDGETYYDM